MFIVISGEIGVGKSTVCKELVRRLRAAGLSCGGIITSKDGQQNIIIENIESGEKMTLASSAGAFAGPSTMKYSFSPEALGFGMMAISANTADVCLIDEIGQLELKGKGFAGVLELIQQGRFKNCVLVIRSFLLPAYLPRFKVKPLIFEATPENRDRLPAAIAQTLLESP
jgi:nucleoside-triphosphatase THEP1